MDRLESIRRAIARLQLRLGAGEIGREEYRALLDELTGGLTPEERAALGLGGRRLGPSGAPPTGVPALDELQLIPGTVLLGRWEVIEELGRGGFGAVVRARDRQLGGDEVAVKVLDPVMVVRAELLERFKREVRAMRRLNHRRVVRVFDYWEEPESGLALISMELIRGGSVRGLLERAMERGVPVPVPVALAILRDVLEGLAAVHAEGVVHRDVTPGNVLLSGAGPDRLLDDPLTEPGAKLVDFGIAVLADPSRLSRQRAGSRVLGTAPYVAPEVLAGRADVGPAADVYGAAAVAYALLTGRLAQGRFRLPSHHRPEVPGGTDELLDAMLQPEPRDRPPVPEALEAATRLWGASVTNARAAWLAGELEAAADALEPLLTSSDESALREVLEHGRILRECAVATPPSGELESVLERFDRAAGRAEAHLADLETGRRLMEREASVRKALADAMEREDEAGTRTWLAELETLLGSPERPDPDVARAQAWLANREAVARAALPVSGGTGPAAPDHPARGEGEAVFGSTSRTPRSGPARLVPWLLLAMAVLAVATLVVAIRVMRADRQVPGTPPALVPTATPVPTVTPAAPERAALVVRSTVPGGEVWLDGEARGPAPRTLTVPPGRHELRMTRAGCRTAERWVSVQAGERREVVLELVCPTPTRRPRPTPKPRVPATATAAPVVAAPVPVQHRSGDRMVEPVLDMAFRFVPAGTFTMGSPDDEPGHCKDERRHRVRITRGFWMGETEVTQRQYRALMGKNPSYFTACGGDCPAENVGWLDAVRFANALSRKAGLGPCYEITPSSVRFEGPGCQGYRLPTEAEWEYAARAGTTAPFWNGRCLGSDAANYGAGHRWKVARRAARATERSPSGATPRTPGACTRSWGTSRSGAGTGTGSTRPGRSPIRWVRRPGLSGSTAAGGGSTVPPPAAPPTGAATPPIAGSATSVSAWSEPPPGDTGVPRIISRRSSRAPREANPRCGDQPASGPRGEGDTTVLGDRAPLRAPPLPLSPAPLLNNPGARTTPTKSGGACNDRLWLASGGAGGTMDRHGVERLAWILAVGSWIAAVGPAAAVDVAGARARLARPDRKLVIAAGLERARIYWPVVRPAAREAGRGGTGE